MPKIEQDLTTAEIYGPIPEDIYTVRAENPVLLRSKACPADKPENMVDFDLLVEGGEFDGKKAIPFPHHLMIGGLTREGKPMPLGRMCEFLDAFGIRWSCKSCGKSHTGFDTTDKRHYKCPACHKVGGIVWNTDDIQGKRAKAAIGTEPIDGSEERRNNVKKFYPLAAKAA